MTERTGSAGSGDASGAPSRLPRFPSFYPGNLKEQIAQFLSSRPAAPASAKPPEAELPERLVAAAVPHAGWRYSGAVAARTLRALAERSRPDAILFFGAVHRELLDRSAVYPDGTWATPLGRARVAHELTAELLRELGDAVEANPGAHDTEHSIEVLVPMTLELFPGIPIAPVMVPPHANPASLGRRVAALLRGRSVVAVASTDLTHYGSRFGFTPAGSGASAHAWMRSNDYRMLHLAKRLEAEEMPAEASANRNACGPGALAAATAFARELGAVEGRVLERTDSHEVTGEGEPFESAVGYAGLVF